MCILERFLDFIKGVKFPFEFQERTWDFLENALTSKGLISRGGENFMVIVVLWLEA